MPETGTSWAGELLVALRRDAHEPIHRQLEHELRTAVRSGRLSAGSVLPSTRALADQLGLSRGVVVEAYEQLVAEGYLTARPGGATRVSATVTEARPSPAVRAAPTPPEFDFGYGRPDVSEFPRQAWLRAVRRVLDAAPNDRLSYLDDRGAPELREALTSYLNRVRGTAADPERIVICNGFAQALGLLTQVIKAAGATRIAVEDPGQRDSIRAARQAGLEVVPIPVDEAGLDVEALGRSRADAVIVTPAHHFPTGAVLSAERRAGLEAWATAGDRLVIEDDYDAEYRYDREPIGAIHGLAPEHVVYAGSASKTLAPGLRVGWMIVPSSLLDRVAEAKEASDRGSSSIEQLALADFLGRGDFDRHLRHMRPIYRARRDTLLRALQEEMPDLRPVGASAGLHVLAWLPADVDEAAVVELAAVSGVAVAGVAPYRVVPQGPGGLLFGYGTVTEARIAEGVRRIAAVIGQARIRPLGVVRTSSGR
jgi:GntR family transcriptional regulator / MocR family aminotransferase